MRVTLEDVYVLLSPLDTCGMDDMERQRRARYQKYRGEILNRAHFFSHVLRGTDGDSGETREMSHKLGTTHLHSFLHAFDPLPFLPVNTSVV